MPPRPPISPEKRKERYLEAVRDKMAKLYACATSAIMVPNDLIH